MTIIQKLLGKQDIKDRRYYNLISKFARLKEVDEYLHNLDKQAEIYQKSIISSRDEYIISLLEKRNENLLQLLQSKISMVLTKGNMDVVDLACCANKLKTALDNDVDMLDMQQMESINGFKTYLISNTILDAIHNLEIKNSITL